MSDAAITADFTGHPSRECGEHRTVGAHRAWCFDCTEWCYPSDDGGCKGCRLGGETEPKLYTQVQADVIAAEARASERQRIRRVLVDYAEAVAADKGGSSDAFNAVADFADLLDGDTDGQ